MLIILVSKSLLCIMKIVLLQIARGKAASSIGHSQQMGWENHKMMSFCHTFNMPAAVFLPKDSHFVLWAAVIFSLHWVVYYFY